eukprot:1662202-Heterocapsa_arctica.AAC.1
MEGPHAGDLKSPVAAFEAVSGPQAGDLSSPMAASGAVCLFAAGDGSLRLLEHLDRSLAEVALPGPE